VEDVRLELAKTGILYRITGQLQYSATCIRVLTRFYSTTVPYKGAVVEVSGIASHVGLNGMLTIEIENIIPNVPLPPPPLTFAMIPVQPKNGSSNFASFASSSHTSTQRSPGHGPFFSCYLSLHPTT
jgi:hypothetical protein